MTLLPSHGPVKATQRKSGRSGWNSLTSAPSDVGAILDADYGIAVRTGLRCAPLVHADLATGLHDALRFSLGRFNTTSDMDQAIDATAAIAGR